MAKTKGTKVQSVVCSKERFYNAGEARTWVKSHGFSTSKVDETKTSYRFRQFEPSSCVENTFRTIELDRGVKGIICKPKEE